MGKILQKLCVLVICLLFQLSEIQANEEWWEYGHFYQVYPRSFQDSDHDGIGDLNGIASRLPHLKSINVSGVWLSPIFQSPLKDWGYDVSDFRRIHWEYGTMADFEGLAESCKELDIKLILDFVPNHSSDQHEWFRKSADPHDPEYEKYKDYFVWNEGKILENGTRAPPSNWMSVMRGSAWTWVGSRKAFYYHQFMKEQPDLNFRNEDVSNDMKEVLRFWLRKGVDGFRVDAVPHLFEAQSNADGLYDDEPLSGNCQDDPDAHCRLTHIFTMDMEESYDLIYEWRKVLEEEEFAHKPRILMTEAYTTIPKATKYYGRVENGEIVAYGSQIPFNFELISKTELSSTSFDYKTHIEEWLNNMPIGKGIQANWVLGNHDNSRIATKYGPTRTDIFNILIKTLPGISVTYYGEEIGMTNVDISGEDARLPVRTPFQWDNSTNAGFSVGTQTWLPVADNYTINNAELQASQNVSFLKNFQKLTSLRQNPTFKYGSLKIVAVDEELLVYKREIEDQPSADIFIIALNFGASHKAVDLNLSFVGLPEKMNVVIASIHSERLTAGDVVDAREIVIPPNVGVVIVGQKP